MPSLTDLYNEFRNRLSKQHFGKDQSMIWSTINDPVMAAEKFGDWLNKSYESAGSYDPYSEEAPIKAIESAMGLTGLMQTGALPFAPKGAGTLGSIKSSNADLPYQIQHKPMQIEGGAAPLHDLTQSFSKEIYDNPRLAERLWGSGLTGEKEIIGLLQKLRGKPEEMIDIYRGVPEGVADINPGDWVTLHPHYAKEYGNVISKKVPAKHVTSWPDSLVEFGYYPK